MILQQRAAHNETVLDLIARFVEQHKDTQFPKSSWFMDRKMKVFVRKSKRLLDGKHVWCLDLATIDVYNRGQGIFSQWFLPGFVALNPWDAVFIECVHEPRFARWFERHGWKRKPDDPLERHYYLFRESDHGGPAEVLRQVPDHV